MERTPPLAIVVLAAGQGTRMASARPKVLHAIGGAPMLHHALATARALDPARLIVVVGHGGAEVAAAARAVAPDVAICEQTERRGTGHAVLAAASALAGHDGDLAVIYGDTPFLAADTLRRMAHPGALVALGFRTDTPGRYGRLVLEGEGLAAIVEAADATPAQRALTACNSGVMRGDCATMLRLLARVTPGNAQGEYYLTDLIALARADGIPCRAVFCDQGETVGINDRVELAAAEALFQARARRAAMLGGATLVAPDTVFFGHDTTLARDVVVEPHVVFGPGVRVGEGARIRAFSHLEGAQVAAHAIVGPYARLRPGTVIGAGAHIGNFVEVKAADIGAGTKINHLSYVGDAHVGPGANLGAGTITCNYDGVAKHRTTIGAGAFIGVHTALIAPITVGDGAYVATGTVVSEDVPADALAIARPPQMNRLGAASRVRALFAARKG